MRGASVRTTLLMIISFVWGAAFYAAVFSDARQDVWIEEEMAERLALEEGERDFLDSSERDAVGGGRHLTEHNARRADVVWKPSKTLYRPVLLPRGDTNKERIPGVDFFIREPFHFPLPRYSRSRYELLHSPWVAQLQRYLGSTVGTEVSLVTASIEHLDVLLNWLISAYLIASPPLPNVLVLTLDKSVFDLVSQRNISALYVHEDMVLDPAANITKRFSQVHVVRLSVLRLMNHYGFSVVNYDCDAIVLRNPQPIFNGHTDADIIGTFGKGPFQLYTKWGITLNTGVMLLRSSDKLEYYWELMSTRVNEDSPTTDDQANINLALDRIRTRWVNLDKGKDIDYLQNDIYGIGDRDIIVMLMPENKVCRYVCDPKDRDKYYVWHTFAIKENRTVVNKMSQAKIGNAWFLQSDWLTMSQEAGSQLDHVAWLQHIADPDLIR